MSASATSGDEQSAPGSSSERRAVAPAVARSGRLRELFTFRGRPSANVQLWVGIAAFVFSIAVWALVTGLTLVKPQFFPSPWSVVTAWLGLFHTAGYAADIGISVARVWIAFLASAIVAVPLGMLM